MAIKPICDKCKEELEEFGGLAFSPPSEDGKTFNKFHLCVKCFYKFLVWMDEDYYAKYFNFNKEGR